VRALRRLLYVKAPAPDRERRLADPLSRIEQEASYRTFHTAAELQRLVGEDLAALLSERFAAGGDIDDCVQRSALLDRLCAGIGRAPFSITRSIHLPHSYDQGRSH
jgi:hypothetical protein